MNIQLIQMTPLPSYLAPSVERPTNTDEYNYQAIVIEESGCHYYWAKGISLKISKEVYELVRINSKLFNESTTYRLHEQLEIIKRLSKGRI
jgi:hypothetical protein